MKRGLMKINNGVVSTFDGEGWVEKAGLNPVPRIDPEAAFRAAWRAWNDACEELDHMPGHGEDIQIMKRAAQERGLV